MASMRANQIARTTGEFKMQVRKILKYLRNISLVSVKYFVSICEINEILFTL